MTGQAPGWHPSPLERSADGAPAGTVLRWWDGSAWTHHVAELGTDPAPPSGDAPTAAITLPPTRPVPADRRRDDAPLRGSPCEGSPPR